MMWTVEIHDCARKELRKLSPPLQVRIIEYLGKRIATKDDPRRFGKPLSYDMHGLWRYRVENARLICRICDDELLVLVVKIGDRKLVYR